MNPPGPIITLTTDFGLADGYVGAIKGVILSICAEARIVDVAHDLPPQNIAHAALVLETAVPFYPPGTVHLAVVDPGVGTSRRRLAALTQTAYFVGPDNGIFGLAFRRDPPQRIYAIENTAYLLPSAATTFDGRDVFAPAAAYLAGGLDPAELGPEITDPVALAWPENLRTPQGITGVVLCADRFGNLITSVHYADWPPSRPPFIVELGDQRIPGPAEAFYDDNIGGIADFCKAIFGSSGYLELVRPGGSAAALLCAGPGQLVTVRWRNR